MPADDRQAGARLRLTDTKSGVLRLAVSVFVRLLCAAVLKNDLGDESDVVEAW